MSQELNTQKRAELTVWLWLHHDSKLVMEFLIVESDSKLFIINPSDFDVSNRKNSFQLVFKFDLEIFRIDFDTAHENVFKFKAKGFIIDNIVLHDNAYAMVQSFQFFDEWKFDKQFDTFLGFKLFDFIYIYDKT